MTTIGQILNRATLVSLLFALIPAFACAEEGRFGEDDSGQQLVAERIAAGSGYAIEQLFRLRQQGMGWGDVEIATIIAERADASLEHVAELWRTAEEEWDIVAGEYGIERLGPIISQRKAGPVRDRSGRNGG